MSSLAESHEIDTPVSKGSPLNAEGNSSSAEKLASPVKDEVHSKCSSPKVNGDSCSSSPSASTPTSTPTPPVNGILTPPPTDGDNVSETDKPEKPAGRLKFYKDGVLCLELSHHKEGERTKWVQIRTKTVFPTVVHTTKEATIPCHVSPQSFASPSSSNVLQSRVESSTSHSMSDDGSSMLSSPRLRENTWKQPVPQKGISSSLEYFMKPAVCVLNLRRLFCEKSKSQVLKLNRKPYVCQISTVLCQYAGEHSCSCPLNDNAAEVQKIPTENGDTVDGKENCKEGSIELNGNKTCRRTKPVENYGNNCKLSILVIADRLKYQRQLKLKEEMENGDSKPSSGFSSSRTHVAFPKKRMFKEMDSKDMSAVVRPKKKSPNRNNDSKTILNVPGLNSEFYRRHSIPVEVSSTVGGLKPNTKYCEGDLKSSVLHNHRNSNKSSKNGVSSGKRSENSSPYHIGTKSLSPHRTPKKTISSEEPKVFNNPSPYPTNSAMSLSSLPPQEQEQFQRQTMSKAISYTINSLLNSPGSSEAGNKHSLLKSNNEPAHLYNTASKLEKSINSSSSLKNLGNSFPSEIPHGLFGTRDQNSFLRHLLDTSDPIPLVKSEKNSGKQSTKSPTTSRHSSKASTGETNAVPTLPINLKKSNSSSKVKASNSNKQPTAPPNLNNCQLGPYPPLIHPSLVNSGFPLSLTSAYDSFLRGQDNSSSNALAAAAAAAAFQYGSLLPQHLFSNLNSTMAAAVAASYLGGSQSISGAASSQPLLSTRSPPISHPSSPINYSNSSSSPLNLSQRAWQGGLIPCTGTIPVPFHAPTGDSIHSVVAASHQAHSRERLEKLNEIVDNDTPLNLSKKSRPS